MDYKNKAILEKLYVNEKKSQVDIAKIFSVSRPTIAKYLKKYRIPIRSFREVQLIRLPKRPNIKRLRELYANDLKTQSEIAKVFDVSQKTIANWMRFYNIETRSASKRMTGKLNPMYGKTHSEESRGKMRKANERQFSNPLNRKKHAILTAKQIANGKTGKTHNRLERYIALSLDKENIKYIWQYRLSKYSYDFFLIDFTILLEIHDTFWHADPRFYPRGILTDIQVRNVSNDIRKKKFALENQYRFLALWEHDIEKDTFNIREVIANEI